MALFASVAGWSLDIFDLFLLLFVAPTIGPLFFPTGNPVLSLAGVYAGFAISGIVRPLGGILFGSFADKKGRKNGLVHHYGGRGAYNRAHGGAADGNPGRGVGRSFIPRSARFSRRLYWRHQRLDPYYRHGNRSSVLAGLDGRFDSGFRRRYCDRAGFNRVRNHVKALSRTPYSRIWGWRCMFFTGLLSAIFALFIFYTLNESPYFVELQKKKAVVTKPPINVLFTAEYRSITLLNFLIVTAAASMYYLTAGYLPTFLDVINHVPKPVAAGILSWTGLVGAISCIVVGQLSQWFGRKPAYLAMSIIGIALAIFGVPFLAGATNLTSIMVVSLVFAAFANAQPTLIFLNERYPDGDPGYRNVGLLECGICDRRNDADVRYRSGSECRQDTGESDLVFVGR